VCLTISIEADATDRERLAVAALAASAFGLRVDIEHTSRWPWAQRTTVRATITDGGGCACGLLSDDADWSSESWRMRPDIVEPLARTLEVLLQHGPGRVALEAFWAGDRPHREVRLASNEMGAIVRGKGLGTKVRYIIERA